MIYFTEFDTNICGVVLAGNGKSIVRTDLITDEIGRRFTIPDEWEQNDDMFSEHRLQVLQYFACERDEFDLPVEPQGTLFQMAVWSQLMKIPRGETVTYGEIAATLGKPKASRAVGRATGANPIPLLIPCHRVIGANGRLTGFAHGLELKKTLLEIEKGHKK